MVAIPSSYDQMVQEFNSLVYNPSKRFFTDGDILNYINRGVVETAKEIGGVRVIDSSTITVAGQQDYVLDNAVRQIVGIWYVTGFRTAAEKRVPLDVITQKQDDLINRISFPAAEAPPWGLQVTGVPQPVPKFAIFWPALRTLRIVDPTAVAGDILLLDCLEIPNVLGPGITYLGDSMETGAIIYKAVSLARLKSRETQESNIFDAKWSEACQSIRRMRSKMRRRRQLGDGRFEVTRLKSVDGAV